VGDVGGLERRQLALMLAPFVLGLAGLVAIPAAVTFGLALFEYDLIGSARFVGLENFRELWSDEIFRISFQNSLVFAAIAVPLRLLAALGLALLLHRRARGAGAHRALVVLPTVVPDVAYGLLWLWLLNPLYGPINRLIEWGGTAQLTIWGYPSPQWLTHPNDARAAIVIMSLFTIGEGFVVLLAVRQGLPRELYELAAVEDADWLFVFWRITLPLMTPVLLLLLARDTILSFQTTFVPALIVTEGGPPPYSTTYVPLFVYRNAFEYLRYGYASAATVTMFVLTALIVYVQWRIVRRWRRSVLT
jgi:multiple sugar transport system permease protein